jgi:hypothetical protein
MAKAGSNLEILKSGWTFGGRVHLIGEIVPMPAGFTPMDEEDQQEYYGGKVFYRVTDKPVNVGGAAGWKPKPEPTSIEVKPQPLAAEGQTEFGGASAAFHPVTGALPRSELPDELHPDNSDKPKRTKRKNEEAVSEDEEEETRKPIRLKKNIKGQRKKGLIPAKATKLSSRK